MLISLREVFRRRWKIIGPLFILSAVVHFTGIGHPDSVVFDEVHFGKFATAYIHGGERIFDIHPPHSKLMIGFVGKLAGYAKPFSFENIGQSFQENPAAARLRWMPALWGTLIPVVIFILLSQIQASLLAALVGSLLLLFDNGLLVQTRIIALDGCLILSTLLCLCFTLESLRHRDGKRLWIFSALAGAAAALAVGTKFTGLVVPALSVLCFFELFQWDEAPRAPWRVIGLRLISFTLAFLVIYLGGWWLHFVLLTKPGYSDEFYKLTGSFFTDLVNLHRVMLGANAGITKGHPDSSLWWSWPMDQWPVFYWQKDAERIYFIGNRVVWLGVSVVTFWMTSLIFFGRRLKVTPACRIFLVGFWISWIPYALVTRALFLYHYLPPLCFATLASMAYADGFFALSVVKKRVMWGVVLGIALFRFSAISPVTFGLSMPESYFQWFQRVYLRAP